MSKQNISIVIPTYNEENNISLLISKLEEIIPKDFSTEYIIVDDGSTDNTQSELKNLCDQKKNVKALIFYRNFGHQKALLAGINSATGECVITIDADFQHPPEVVPEMLNAWHKGHDLIVAKKLAVENSAIKLKILRSLGYAIYTVFGQKELVGVSDFRLMDKSIVEYIKNCPERRIVLRGLANRVARNALYIPYTVGKRHSGKSGYSMKKLFRLFMDGITLNGLGPLRYITGLGVLMSITALIGITGVLINYKNIESLVVIGIFISILLTGGILTYLGFLSEFLETIYEEVKKRPHYLIRTTFNLDDSQQNK